MKTIEPAGGQQVGAFFDMDNTVLSASSGRLYLKYLRQINRLSLWRWIVISGHVASYVLGRTDFPRLMSRVMMYATDEDEAETWRLSERWFADMLQHYIADGARTRIAWHREQGHHVALVSASTPYAVGPVAEALGCPEAYLATRLEVIGGKFTGAVIEPACYGAGKVQLTREYARRHDIDLARSYFYSDSDHDLPLLAAVGHPVAVNPNRRLAAIATERGWPRMMFY